MLPLGGQAGTGPRDGESQVVTDFTLTADGEGGFTGGYVPVAAGGYAIRVAVTGSDDKQLGEDSMSITVSAPPAELQTLARNERLLQEIAQASGGQYADIAGLPDLLDEAILTARNASEPTVTPYIVRAYNFTALLLLFVASVTTEWILRRKWQLR